MNGNPISYQSEPAVPFHSFAKHVISYVRIVITPSFCSDSCKTSFGFAHFQPGAESWSTAKPGMKFVTHCWRESLWPVIKAFNTESTRIGDSFTAEFVCRLVSNPLGLKFYMSDDEWGRRFNKCTKNSLTGSLTGVQEVFRGPPNVRLRDTKCTRLTLNRRLSV